MGSLVSMMRGMVTKYLSERLMIWQRKMATQAILVVTRAAMGSKVHGRSMMKMMVLSRALDY